MTHTSGMPSTFTRGPASAGYDGGIRTACAERLESPPGAVFRYSDVNYILLAEIVQRVSGMKLEQFVAREIYQPLKMNDTGFLPAPSKRERIAPTQRIGREMLRGRVHDT